MAISAATSNSKLAVTLPSAGGAHSSYSDAGMIAFESGLLVAGTVLVLGSYLIYKTWQANNLKEATQDMSMVKPGGAQDCVQYSKSQADKLPKQGDRVAPRAVRLCQEL